MSEIGAADYEALPEEVCRRIEVIDGAIVVNADHGGRTSEPHAAWRTFSKGCVARVSPSPTTRTYAVAGVDTGTMVITDPFDLVVDLAT